MKRLLLTIFFLLCASQINADVIAFTETPNPNGHMYMAYITSLAHTSNTGGNTTIRLGWYSNQDTTLAVVGVDPDTLITLGIDSSQVDSIKIIFRNYPVVKLNMSGSDPDSLYLAWYKIVPSDSNTTENTVTFDNATTGQPWDTAGIGLGNDMAATKSAAFGDGSTFDTMMVFYATTAFLGAEDAFRNNRGVLATNIDGTFGDNPITWYVPIQEFKEGLVNSQFVKWAVKPFRIHDADANNQCGLDLSSDDGAGTLQLDLYVYYTPPAASLLPRRRRILTNE